MGQRGRERKWEEGVGHNHGKRRALLDFVLNNSGHKKVLKQEEMGLNAHRETAV